MTPTARVQQAPEKPLLIFDGDCGFCRFWVQRWQRITGDRVEYIPLQDRNLPARFPQLSRSRLESAVHLVTPDGEIYSGADAVFLSLSVNPSWRWTRRLYEHLPGVAFAAEAVYRFIASHRSFFSRITRWIWRDQMVRS